MEQPTRIALPNGRTIELVQGDITHEATHAIVNAANPSLLGGGGVDGAIHAAAGPELVAECARIRDRQGTLPPGKAVSTKAYKLPARYVIHTVGPIWQGGNAGEPRILAESYRNCILLADMLKLTTVAFPSISTGAYGYPIEDAARIALDSVARALTSTEHVRLVRFVLWGAGAFRMYQQAAHELNNNPSLSAD